MEEQIINRVAQSALISLDLAEFIQPGDRVVFDLKDYLFQGLILKEKDFRLSLKELDWDKYRDKYVAVCCSTDAIVPTWAYMLVATYLVPVAKGVVKGSLDELERELFRQTMDRKDWSVFKDAKVVVKGCSDLYDPEFSFTEAAKRLIPWVSSLMYGEPCSTVPVYKKKTKNIG